MRDAQRTSALDRSGSGMPVDRTMTRFRGRASVTGGSSAAPLGGVDLSFLDPPMEPGDLGRIAHYRVLSMLGAGGMGIVFRAEDTHLKRPAALKVMRRECIGSYTGRERFLQEARVAAALESENIATVYQVGVHNEVPYLAMQYLCGESLDSRLEREAPLPVVDSLTIARQIAAGLAAAHDQGLVHRDIKPANIWLEADPATRQFRRVKILDFGLARVLDSSRRLTNMGVIIGTPQYMSPEQASGASADCRADLFSLGTVLYVMLTGHLPFNAPSAAALLVALVAHEPVDVAEFNPTIPPAAQQLVRWLMMKSPTDRPSSAQEVVDTLDEILIEFSAPSFGRGPGSGYHTAADAGSPTWATPGPTLTTTPKPLGHPARPTSGPIGVPPPRPMSGPVPPPAPRAASGPIAYPPPRPATSATAPVALDQLPVGVDPRSGIMPRPTPSRRKAWVAGGVVAAVTVLGAVAAVALKPSPAPVVAADGEDVRVGVLFAKSGPLAVVDQPIVDATHLALDEVNDKGGVLGRKVVIVEADGGATPEGVATKLDELLGERAVKAVFGVGSAADRRTARQTLERRGGVLFHAAPYEGLDRTGRVVFVGPAAAQTALPAVARLMSTGARSIFVVGSDTVDGRAVGAMIQDALKATPGAFAGEAYLPVGAREFGEAARQVRSAKPDVVVNAVTGATAVGFVQHLRSTEPRFAGRLLHLAHLEDYHKALDPTAVVGDVVACSYLAGRTNDAFAAKFRAKYGATREVTDAMAAAYTAVHLWAAAATAAKSVEPDAVLAAVPGVEVASPFGPARLGDDRQLPHRLVLAEFQPDGGLRAVHTTDPVPGAYPKSRTPAEWDRVVQQLYYRWGQRWRGPAAGESARP